MMLCKRNISRPSSFVSVRRRKARWLRSMLVSFPPVELHIRLDWGLLMCCSFPTVSFSYPNTSTEEVAMNMSRTGSKKGSTTFTSNASEVTPDQMRYSLTLDVNFLAWACSLCKRAMLHSECYDLKQFNIMVLLCKNMLNNMGLIIYLLAMIRVHSSIKRWTNYTFQFPFM